MLNKITVSEEELEFVYKNMKISQKYEIIMFNYEVENDFKIRSKTCSSVVRTSAWCRFWLEKFFATSKNSMGTTFDPLSLQKP